MESKTRVFSCFFLRFYYIITGSVLLTPTPESGIKEVILDSGAGAE